MKLTISSQTVEIDTGLEMGCYDPSIGNLSDFTQVVGHTVSTLVCLSVEAAECGLGGVLITGILKTRPRMSSSY